MSRARYTPVPMNSASWRARSSANRDVAADLAVEMEVDAAVDAGLRRGAATTLFSSLKLGMP